MTDEEKLEQFLSTQQHMVLAVTLEDGTPWAVPVRIKKWQDREFEWDSRLDTVHSQALERHAQMAITLFQKDRDAQICVCASGRGELVEKNGEYGRYRFTAERVWLNDETFVKREVN